MKSLLIPVAAILLTGCSSTAVVCQQWRNKQITDEKALAILGIDPTPVKTVAKDAAPIIHSDGTEVTGDVTVTISGASKVGAYCLGIEHGELNPHHTCRNLRGNRSVEFCKLGKDSPYLLHSQS